MTTLLAPRARTSHVRATRPLRSTLRLAARLLATLVGLAAPLAAQDKLAQVDQLLGAFPHTAPGCAVAVAERGKLVVNKAYGLADIERATPNTPTTLFDAGSLRKQFVSAAILLLVQDGRLALNDDVRKHIPELPDYGHTITLDHLLTHTSGLRDWPALLNMAAGSPDAMSMILRQRGLNFAPGTEWSYSNSGYVLLTEIVVRRSGMPFSEFSRKRLFEPLGMQATTYADEVNAVVAGGAAAYEKQGDAWKPDMMHGTARGGGALLTTASDLLTWDAAIADGRLSKYVTAKIQEPATLTGGRKLDYARGLFLDNSPEGLVVWHTGSAAAYKSMLGRFPQQELAIAIMCNGGDATNPSAISRRLYDIFVPPTSAQPAAAPAPGTVVGGIPAGMDVSARAGLFFNERTGESMRLVIDGPRFRVANGPALEPLSLDRFRRVGAALTYKSQDAFELHFTSADRFEFKSMEGSTTIYRRARPYTPSAEELAAIAGRYTSEELRATIELTAGPQGLLGKLNDNPGPGFRFLAVDPDVFQFGPLTLHFKRDASGQVISADFTNPVLRNVPFTRGAAR